MTVAIYRLMLPSDAFLLHCPLQRRSELHAAPRSRLPSTLSARDRGALPAQLNAGGRAWLQRHRSEAVVSRLHLCSQKENTAPHLDFALALQRRCLAMLLVREGC